jgi:hypothetical protein
MMPSSSAPSASIRAGRADSAGASRNRNPAEDALRAGSVHQPPPDAAAARRSDAAEKRGPADIDMVIVRENTEGLYCQNGGFLYKNTPHEVANQIEVTTRRGVERAIRYAFEYAKQFNRKKVTLVAKTNVLRFAHNLWQRAFDEVRANIPASKPIITTSMPARCTW